MLQGQQLLGAADLYKADNGEWPKSMAVLLSSKYLSSIPVAAAQAETLGTARAAAGDMDTWVMPLAGVPLFVIPGTVSPVCRNVNKKAYGLDGILRSASTKYMMQCYGVREDGLLMVVGRTGDDLEEVSASPLSSVVLGPVTQEPAPADPLADSWLVAPGAPTPVPPLSVQGPSVAYEGLGLTNGVLVFPATPAGSSCQERTIYVRNNGDTPVVMGSGASVPAPYTLGSSDCAGQTLAPGAFCTVSVGFTPLAEGSYGGGGSELSWPDAGGALSPLPLAGTSGAAGGPTPGGTGPVGFTVGGVPTTGWAFPNTPVGESSAGQTIDIRNNTSDTWDFGSNPVTVSGPFAITENTCPSAKLSPSGTCRVTIVYLSAVAGPSGSYPLTVLLPDGTQSSLPLTGTGTDALFAQALLSTAFLDFGSIATNTKVTRQVMLSNTGTGELTLTTAPELSASTSLAFKPGLTSCAGSLGVNESCLTDVEYAPTVVGAASGDLTFATNAVGSPGKVSLTGTAYNPVSLATATLPTGKIGQAYPPFSFSSLLGVSNEVTPALAAVSWSTAGTLPAGLGLSASGVLSGTPTALTAGAGAEFTVLAAYKFNNGQQAYTIKVGDAVLQVTSIASGYGHTCVVTTARGVKCWGDDYYGQLGNDAARTDQLVPVDVLGLTSDVASIDAGRHHTCAVTTAGGLKCWGSGTNGELGNSTVLADSPTPVYVSGLSSGVSSVSAGDAHTCALMANTGLKCWGRDGQGQIGNDAALTRQPLPVDVLGMTSGMASVSAGGTHTCAVSSAGELKCWGSNALGQLGNGLGDQPVPSYVSGLSTGVMSVSAGLNHTCAVTSAGALKCWGDDSSGQLGNDAALTKQPTPVTVAGLGSGVLSVGAGWVHTCAVTAGGGVSCWGVGNRGQLGIGSALLSTPVPVAVTELSSGVSSLSVGAYHTCAMTAGGGVSCWGYNFDGQIGKGSPGVDQFNPVIVSE